MISGSRGDATGELEPLPSPRGARADTGEEHGQLRRLQLDPVAGAGRGQLEAADLESFVRGRPNSRVTSRHLEANGLDSGKFNCSPGMSHSLQKESFVKSHVAN